MHVSAKSPNADLCDLVRGLSAAHQHLGHVFAEQRGIYHTDFRALLLIHAAQTQAPPTADAPASADVLATAGDDARATSITAGELAQALELSSGAVTYLVERLAQSGHVRREVDPLDRRKVLLCSTALGDELVAQFSRPLCGAVETALADCDETALDTFRSLVGRLERTMRRRADEIALESAPAAS